MFEDKIAKFIVKNRFLLIATMAIITVFFVFQIHKVELKTDLSDLLPQKHEYVKLHNEVRDTFGGANILFIKIAVKEGDIFNPETLQKIKTVSEELMFLPGADRYKVVSIAQRKVKDFKATDWGMEIKPLMWPDIPETKEELEYLKNSIYTNDMVYGSMVSIDSRAALISVQFRENEKLDFKAIFTRVNQLCDSISDTNTDVAVAGETMIRGYIYSFLGQTKLIFIITVFAVLFLLFIYTRQLQMVLMPSISACISAVWGLGFVGILGYNLDPLVLVVPLLITARTISHSVQFNERFIEEYAKTQNVRESTEATVKALFYPGLAGIITDTAGIAVLIAIPIPFLQKLGLISAFWAFTTVFTVLILNPLVLLFLPPFNKKSQIKKGIFEKILVKTASLYTIKNSWIIISITIVLSIVAIIYQKDLKVGDANPGSPLLRANSQYNMDAKSINESFPGLDPLLVVLEGKEEKTMYNKHILDILEKYQYYMEQLPTVGGSLSMADLVKKINMKLHEDHPKFEVIPPTRDEIGTLNYMLMQGSDRGDLDALTTFDDKTGSVVIYFKNHLGDTIREAIKATKEFIKDNPVKGAEFKMAGGVIGTLAAANEEIFKSQIQLLLMTFGLTIVFCAIAFRSLVAGVLLSVPLAVSNYMVFAYMGLKNIGLNMNTLPVATIAIGIGVDYGIYFLSRVREEYPLTENLQKAMATTVVTTGKAITFTALTVALGVVFWTFSSIRFQAEMGMLLTLVTFLHLIGTLILLAALILVIKPKCITNTCKGGETY